MTRRREGEVAFEDALDQSGSSTHDEERREYQSGDLELVQEIRGCITRLFRVSNIIRQAAPTDTFAKALTRDRYKFDDRYDFAHVGLKYPKLETPELTWLQRRLGRAITCLLYTSPSPRDGLLSRMPSSA